MPRILPGALVIKSWQSVDTEVEQIELHLSRVKLLVSIYHVQLLSGFSRFKMLSLAKFIAAAAVGIAMSPFVSAAGNVTVKELTGGCSAYPGYDASAGQAGPWSMQVKDTDGGVLDNHGLTAIYSRGSTGIRWGYVSSHPGTITRLAMSKVKSLH